MRHAHLLGAADPLMHRLVPTLVGEMGGAYPELKRAQAQDRRDPAPGGGALPRPRLGRGMGLLDEATAGLSCRRATVLSGDVAFKLYDTYGFPLDLTQDAVRAKGLTVDTDGFDAAMETSSARSGARVNWAGLGPAGQREAQWFAVRDRVGATDFTGYDAVDATGALDFALSGKTAAEVQSANRPARPSRRCSTSPPSTPRAAARPATPAWSNGHGGSGQVTDTQKQAGDAACPHAANHPGRFAEGRRPRRPARRPGASA